MFHATAGPAGVAVGAAVSVSVGSVRCAAVLASAAGWLAMLLAVCSVARPLRFCAAGRELAGGTARSLDSLPFNT